MTERGLSDYRVIDLAGPAGWYGTKLLADLGADVIRVEPPGGDPARGIAPFFRDVPGPGRSLAFSFYNTSKRSVMLDLDAKGDRERFRRLAAGADLVIETGRYHELAAAGIGYEALLAASPGLIWASITPFGLDGPRADWKGSDLVALAAGGLVYLNGFTEDPPIRTPLEQAYHQGGIAAVTGSLLALQHRHASGEGQLIDVSLQAAVATTTENTIGFWDVMGTVRKRMGTMGFQGFEVLLRCKDGWTVAIHGNRWEGLLAWAEEAGIADDEWRDPRWHERENRNANQARMNEFVKQLIASQTLREVGDRAPKYRLAIQPVQKVSDLLTDPQLAFRGFWQPVAHDNLGATLTFPGAPFQSTAGPWAIRRRAPLPGEHTTEILAEVQTPSPQPSPEQGRGSKSGATKPAPIRLNFGGDFVKPLAGIRVLDFTQSVTGPLTTRTLADHGAEVLKVEWGRRPDGIRNMSVPRPPGNSSVNVSSTFNIFNAGKIDFTVNMNRPEGRDVIRELLAVCDVVIDNYGVDPLPKWGLTYEEIRAIRPDIIMARSSVMGRSGPNNRAVGFGYGIAAVAGWNELMGFPGRPPVGLGPAYPDTTVNCHHLLIAILTALEYRRKTGQGQYIDLAQYESTIAWLGPAILEYTANGRLMPPPGNRHPDYAPHGLYPTRGDDCWIAISVDQESWPAFKAPAGLPELEGERFATHGSRKANEDALDDAVAAWTRGLDAEDLAIRLQSAGVAAAAVADGPMLLADPQLAHRGHFVTLGHPEAGERVYDRNAFQLTATPGEPSRAPLLGEHNDRVFQELLGWTEDAIANGYVEGFIE